MRLTRQMLSNKALFVLLGLFLLTQGSVAEDAVDGEVSEEGVEAVSEAEEDLEAGLPSPDAQVSFVFAYPNDANAKKELFAGRPVKYLIGFQNRGEKDFTIKFAETSFRFHQDYSYHLQNFSLANYNAKVAPKEEVTVDNTFHVFEQFAGRPLGLVVRLHYEDSDNHFYIHTAFNETITVADDDANYQTETFFMYVIFAIIGVGLLLLGQHFLNKLTRKHGVKKAPVVEQGTTNKNEVDFEWIPREVLKSDKKSPKPGSPRPRKAQKAD